MPEYPWDDPSYWEGSYTGTPEGSNNAGQELYQSGQDYFYQGDGGWWGSDITSHYNQSGSYGTSSSPAIHEYDNFRIYEDEGGQWWRTEDFQEGSEYNFGEGSDYWTFGEGTEHYGDNPNQWSPISSPGGDTRFHTRAPWQQEDTLYTGDTPQTYWLDAEGNPVQWSTSYFDTYEDYTSWADDVQGMSYWQTPSLEGGEIPMPEYMEGATFSADNATPYWIQHAKFQSPDWQPDIPDFTPEGGENYWPSYQESGPNFDQLWNMAESGTLDNFLMSDDVGLSGDYLTYMDPLDRGKMDILLEDMGTNEKAYKQKLFQTDYETGKQMRDMRSQVDQVRNKSGLGYIGGVENAFDQANRDFAKQRKLTAEAADLQLESEITDYKSRLHDEKKRQEEKFYDDLAWLISTKDQ